QVRSVRYHGAVRQHPSVSHPDLLVQNTLRTFKRTSPIQKKMITVEKFKNIAEAFVVKLGFKGCKVPATEEQTMNLLKDHSGSWLVAVLPTLASGGSNPDAPTKVNQTIFYIIEKEKDGTSHQKQLEQ